MKAFRRSPLGDQIYSTPYSGSPLPYPPPPGASVPVTPSSTFRHAVNRETPTFKKPRVVRRVFFHFNGSHTTKIFQSRTSDPGSIPRGPGSEYSAPGGMYAPSELTPPPMMLPPTELYGTSKSLFSVCLEKRRTIGEYFLYKQERQDFSKLARRQIRKENEERCDESKYLYSIGALSELLDMQFLHRGEFAACSSTSRVFILYVPYLPCSYQKNSQQYAEAAETPPQASCR